MVPIIIIIIIFWLFTHTVTLRSELVRGLTLVGYVGHGRLHHHMLYFLLLENKACFEKGWLSFPMGSHFYNPRVNESND